MNATAEDHEISLNKINILKISHLIKGFYQGSSIEILDLPNGNKLISLALLTDNPTVGLLKTLEAASTISILKLDGTTLIEGASTLSDHPSTTPIWACGRLSVFFEVTPSKKNKATGALI